MIISFEKFGAYCRNYIKRLYNCLPTKEPALAIDAFRKFYYNTSQWTRGDPWNSLTEIRGARSASQGISSHRGGGARMR